MRGVIIGISVLVIIVKLNSILEAVTHANCVVDHISDMNCKSTISPESLGILKFQEDVNFLCCVLVFLISVVYIWEYKYNVNNN